MTLYEPGERNGSDIIWEIIRAPEGGYIIKNQALKGDGSAVGCLTWTRKKSPSGHFIQVLSNSINNALYEPGGKYRREILWDIIRAPEGGYIVKNRAFTGTNPVVGCLTWTRKESESGRLVQVLSERVGSACALYEPGGKNRRDIIFDFIPRS